MVTGFRKTKERKIAMESGKVSIDNPNRIGESMKIEEKDMGYGFKKKIYWEEGALKKGEIRAFKKESIFKDRVLDNKTIKVSADKRNMIGVFDGFSSNGVVNTLILKQKKRSLFIPLPMIEKIDVCDENNIPYKTD